LGREGPDGQEMKIAVDTNVLVRVAVRDHAEQAVSASKLMDRAEVVVIAVPCLCEFVWVLRSAYRFRPFDIANAIRILLAVENVETNRPAVDAGLAMLDAGGDFADGVIAYEGRWLGAETFVSFDRKAVEMIKQQGQPARVL
jgi:predicted nucleic-acid-binding protein